MKTLITNGKIYDGSGRESFMGQILLSGDRIERVAPIIDTPADRVIDLQGRSVAPGFIDGHSHNDWFAIKKDPLPYFAPFIRQGIAIFVGRSSFMDKDELLRQMEELRRKARRHRIVREQSV